TEHDERIAALERRLDERPAPVALPAPVDPAVLEAEKAAEEHRRRVSEKRREAGRKGGLARAAKRDARGDAGRFAPSSPTDEKQAEPVEVAALAPIYKAHPPKIVAPEGMARPTWGNWQACALYLAEVLDAYPHGTPIYRADMLRLLVSDAARKRCGLRVGDLEPVISLLVDNGLVRLAREWVNTSGYRCQEYSSLMGIVQRAA
ncbi:MAG TPA: hypothetical protein PK095_15590, partial [Myxococcota bacterium]|nr:hypothetical protein [Myxococcota bacterium]